MTRYVRLEWQHDCPDDPVLIFYEVTDDGAVSRMVDVFADDRSVANTLAWEMQACPTFIGDSLISRDFPPLDELPNDDEFTPTLITKSDFEAAFSKAIPITELPRSHT